MSAPDEQPATLPPPAGEDDAYNAATKVGAMPAEVMAKLRAEGLLPEEEEGPSPAAPRPTSALTPRSPPPPPPQTGPLPMLYSTAPPAMSPKEDLEGYAETTFGSEPPGPVKPKAPPLPILSVSTPSAEIRPDGEIVIHGQDTAPTSSVADETPIAFVAPPSEAVHENRSPGGEEDRGLDQELRAFGSRRLSRQQVLALMVAAMVVVVGLLFAMALISQRR